MRMSDPAVVLVSGALFASVATSDVLVVDVNGETGFQSIQSAIDAADDGDVVEVRPGVYTSTGDVVVNFQGKRITVRSTNGSEDTIIDGEWTRRGVLAWSSETAETVLDGFTIRHGSESTGGGMAVVNASPTVINCSFIANWSSSSGGGMAVSGGCPELVNCSFSDNSSALSGGALSLSESLLPGGPPCVIRLRDVAFIGNSTGNNGGAVSSIVDGIELIGCRFEHNRCNSQGGGFSSFQSPSVFIDCTFKGNLAPDGGAISNVESSCAMVNCEFTQNEAQSSDGAGGAVWNLVSALDPAIEISFLDCRFESNRAVSGGAVANSRCSPVFAGCTFLANIAYSGGGVWNFNSTPEYVSCRFEANGTPKSDDGSGGAAFEQGNGLSTYRDCVFEGNTVGILGGAIRLDGIASANLDGCAFTGNQSGDLGGALHFAFNSIIQVDNCTFESNVARSGGGIFGLFLGDGSASRIRNCTFEANSVTATGGGVGLTDASPIIENCTFRGNEAAENGGGLASLNAQPLLSENLFCGNSLSQLSGNWQNGGGNVILNSCPTSCPADLDGSGVVGGADLGLLLAAFGGDDPMADLDGNGLVDGGDLGLLLVAWGTTCP